MERFSLNEEQIKKLNIKMRNDVYKLSRCAHANTKDGIKLNEDITAKVFGNEFNKLNTISKEAIFYYITNLYMEFICLDLNTYRPSYLVKYGDYYVPSVTIRDAMVFSEANEDIIRGMLSGINIEPTFKGSSVDIDKILDLSSYVKMAISDKAELSRLLTEKINEDNSMPCLLSSNTLISAFLADINTMYIERDKGIIINGKYIEYDDFDIFNKINDAIYPGINDNVIYVDFSKK